MKEGAPGLKRRPYTIPGLRCTLIKETCKKQGGEGLQKKNQETEGERQKRKFGPLFMILVEGEVAL